MLITFKTNEMNKMILIIGFLLINVCAAYSQTAIGKVVDEKQVSVPYANVVLLSLPDSTFVQGTVTDEQGNFALGGIEQGSSLLQVSYIGYKTLLHRVKDANVGTLVLQADAIMLGEAVVTGHRPTYTVKGGSLTTHVQNTLLSSVGTGTDVLKRIPGVHIDPEQKVEVFGKGAPLVYINGRQVRDNSELEQLNSKDIAKVELITNPGAEYDAEVKAVLKIKTVKTAGEGLGGYVRLAEGKGHEWRHQQQVNLNYRKGGLDLFGMIQHQFFKQWQEESIQNDIYGDTHWTLTDDARFRMNDYARALGTQLGINYQLNESHSFGGTYQLMRMPYSGGQIEAFQSCDILADGQMYDRMNTYFLMDIGSTTHKVNAYYNGKIAGKLEIDFNFDYVKGKSYRDQQVDEESAEQEDRTVNSFSNADYDLWVGKLVLSYPLGSGTLKLGAEASNTDRSSDYYMLENIVDASDTRVKEQKYAAFASWNGKFGVVSLNAGLRYEHAQFDYYEEDVRQREQSRSFDDVFPNVSVSFPIKKTHNSISYSVKTRRPAYSLLSSAVQYSNRYMYQQGNPQLQPETRHDVTWMTGYRWLNFSASYQCVKNFIWVENSLYNDVGSILLQTHRNYDKLQRLNVHVSAAPKIGCWHPSWGIYFTQQYFSTETIDGKLEYNNPLVTLKWDNDFRLPLGFVFTVSGEYSSAGSSADRQRFDYGTLSGGLRKQFLKNQLTVSLQGEDLLNTYRSKWKAVTRFNRNSNETFYDSRKVMLSATWRFNATRSKYKGTGAANEELQRL